jgi:carbamoyl-phosphate synthase small subunit
VKGKLVLQDGSEFYGKYIGAPIETSGEVVFNTSMVGYPESLTDPSYKGQILVFTYPMIGNYGIPGREKSHDIHKYFESDRAQVRGVIINDYTPDYNHWNASQSLDEFLKEFNVPALYGIDTRKLTKKLRDKGVMLGKITNFNNNEQFHAEDPNASNLVDEVSTKKIVEYKNGQTKILLVDCGVKNNIIRSLLNRNVSVKRVPWDYNFVDDEYDGIVLSNGPGDPKKCEITIEHIKQAMQKDKPILGICLGNQLLALASGGNTYKLQYGHRSQNQPCIVIGTNSCYMTSQNHGFAVDQKTLPPEWRVWFENVNDRTCEGIRHLTKPFLGTQFHPEGYPGPSDTEFVFDEFLELVRK